MGIKDKLLYQFYQILTNREVMVQIDGCTSEPKKVKNGLGQGAPSSVVLADIYSSSIGPKDTKTRIKVCFVDDMTLVCSVPSDLNGLKEVQDLLNSIYKDAKDLDLRLNGSKFQVMRVCEEGVNPPSGKLKDPEGKEIVYKNQIKS